jgi:hypothetical protein
VSVHKQPILPCVCGGVPVLKERVHGSARFFAFECERKCGKQTEEFRVLDRAILVWNASNGSSKPGGEHEAEGGASCR